MYIKSIYISISVHIFCTIDWLQRQNMQFISDRIGFFVSILTAIGKNTPNFTKLAAMLAALFHQFGSWKYDFIYKSIVLFQSVFVHITPNKGCIKSNSKLYACSKQSKLLK